MLKILLLRTECVSVTLCTIRISSDYFPKQPLLNGFHKWDGNCLLGNTNWILKYNSDNFITVKISKNWKFSAYLQPLINNDLLFNFSYADIKSEGEQKFRVEVYCAFNTLRTGDADLRFYITTVQEGWCKSAFLTRACFPCTIHLIMQYIEPVSEWSYWRMFIETWPHSELTFRHRASSI